MGLESALEQQRIDDLLRLVRLISGITGSALDVGARDGRFSRHLTERYKTVLALDLQMPSIHYPGIDCVVGDVTALRFPTSSFNLVVCTEVLEHIPPRLLFKACSELSRVTNDYLLVGVPCDQDIRVGRTTCSTCFAHNPPWGHVNSFTDDSLRSMFPGMLVERESWVGQNSERTNFISSMLMDMAGNPYGTYGQEETCIRCGANLVKPLERMLPQKALAKLAFWVNGPFRMFHGSRPNWIHLLLRKGRSDAPGYRVVKP